MKTIVCSFLFFTAAFSACATQSTAVKHDAAQKDADASAAEIRQEQDTGEKPKNDTSDKGGLFGPSFKKPQDMNIRLIVTGRDDSPRKVYYRISIDDEDAGRTTIGTGTEEKIFETMIPAAQHVLLVEKFVLDEEKDRYVRVKNIDQPKPETLTFDLPEDRILVIRLTDNGGDAAAEYRTEFERDDILPLLSD